MHDDPPQQGDLLSDAIRLYTYAMSPFAAKVHCFLNFKQLAFEPYYIHPLRVRAELPVGTQVPVLTLGDESRADSTPIGIWLDELYPERPLLPAAGPERDKLVALNDWVSERMIPASFRSYYPGAGINKLLNAWKLSFVLSSTARGGLNPLLRWGWPLLIRRVGFLRALVAQADDGLPVRASKFKIYDAFIERLEGGPFLAGRSEPSMPDLAAYPQFALFYLAGFKQGEDVLERPVIMEWMRRMRPYIAGEHPLLPAAVCVRELP